MNGRIQDQSGQRTGRLYDTSSQPVKRTRQLSLRVLSTETPAAKRKRMSVSVELPVRKSLQAPLRSSGVLPSTQQVEAHAAERNVLGGCGNLRGNADLQAVTAAGESGGQGNRSIEDTRR